MLNLSGEGQIFPHSKEFEAGQGKIRPGQATIVVATDGSGDCDTIQEAYKRMPAAGGVIYVKEGTYEISADFTIAKSNLVISGAGKATHINMNGNRFFINTVNYVALKDLYIHGGYIQLEGGTYCTFMGLWIEDAASSAFLLVQPGVGCRIQDCSVVDSGRYAIECEDCDYPILVNNFLQDALKGISGAYLKNAVVAGNVITDMTEDGIYLANAGCDGNCIANNIFLVMGGDAVEVHDVGGTKNIILGNQMVGFAITDSGTGTIKEHNAT